MRVVLLGPQRTPTVDRVAASMDLDGPVATITAGWQEREPDDAELDAQLGGRSTNLRLYARWLDVQDRDPTYAAADRKLRAILDELQELYLVRLDHALQAAYDVQRRAANDQLRAVALEEAIGAVRDLDARHVERISEIHDEFYTGWPPHERPVIAEHRAKVAHRLGDATALVVTGGHVGVLVSAMHLFNIAAALRSPVIAWSAGAMALADRIVLFHDRSPLGLGHAEVYGSGLSLVRGVVPLPHAQARLLLDDTDRMSVLARRFAPARCVVLEKGTRVDTDTDGRLPDDAPVLRADGRVTTQAAA